MLMYDQKNIWDYNPPLLRLKEFFRPKIEKMYQVSRLKVLPRRTRLQKVLFAGNCELRHLGIANNMRKI
ncbi:hypothetical protein AKJ60_01115 [candidate division MSBL1 archaeon SCGC-AAA385M11]|nr:hypothetical protein AKJ60_01115 [candidate division MSBL1 archaeon SCGC-AAA385M11]